MLQKNPYAASLPAAAASTSSFENEGSPADGTDPRGLPIKLTDPITVRNGTLYPNYRDSERANQGKLNRGMTLLPGRAAGEFLTGWGSARSRA